MSDASTPAAVLRAALEGGADMLQLRDPALSDDELLEVAGGWRSLADEHGALLWLNDRPDLALRAGADGVHVGQDDMPVAQARREAGGELLVGLSTHSPEQLEAGIESGADQLSVGPVWETPTKPGRPAAGLDYVRHAAQRRPPVPWFAIGGIDAGERGRGGRRRRRARRGGARDPPRARPARGRRPAQGGAGEEARWRSAVAASGESSASAPAREPGGAPAAPPAEGDSDSDRMARGYARGRAKDEAARAALVPLAPGERPRAVTVAGVVAAFIGLANLVAFLAGMEIRGEQPSAVGVGLFTFIMLAAAYGCFRVRYWAVLGMQALLALTILHLLPAADPRRERARRGDRGGGDRRRRARCSGSS